MYMDAVCVGVVQEVSVCLDTVHMNAFCEVRICENAVYGCCVRLPELREQEKSGIHLLYTPKRRLLDFQDEENRVGDWTESYKADTSCSRWWKKP